MSSQQQVNNNSAAMSLPNYEETTMTTQTSAICTTEPVPAPVSVAPSAPVQQAHTPGLDDKQPVTEGQTIQEVTEQAKEAEKGLLLRAWEYVKRVLMMPVNFVKGMFADKENNTFVKLYEAGKAAIMRGWEKLKAFFTNRDSFSSSVKAFGSFLVGVLKLALGLMALNYLAAMFGIAVTTASIAALAVAAFGIAVISSSKTVNEQIEEIAA